MGWAKAKESRDQIVLFAEKLDDAVAQEHPVRTLDAILDKVDWTNWEADYVLTVGQPPIHPRVLAGIILYGLLKRIRTSRALEEALQVRLDFRWLAEGRSIDHSTIAAFRTLRLDRIGELFVQIGLIAQQMGHVNLATLGYDGTRLRASNRRTGTRTPAELREARKQLTAEFEEHQRAVEEAQTAEDEAFDAAAAADRQKQLADEQKQLSRRADQIDAALAEIERIEAAGKKVPDRLPITDPHCRIAKNKEGGFAPNYNPTATVDADSGLIVAADVISGIDEQSHMHEAIEDVRDNFMHGDRDRPIEVLADGLMATGENIAACKDANIDFYTPAGPDNPAYRDDPSQPVAAEKIDDLPLRGKRPKQGQPDERTFDKSAFLYDAEADVFYCPMGKPLSRKSQRKDHTGADRFLYRAEKSDCSACPLRSKCFKNSRNQYGRRIECGVHEKSKQAHVRRMQSGESREKYSRRAAVTERPFGLIKSHFGVREFLVRGLEKVRCEWQWLCAAHNIHSLLNLSGPFARATLP